MPFIIADDEGRICHARQKVYNTERGAKMGYAATLDNYIQMWYLYDDDLDYHFYCQKKIPNDGSLIGNILAQVHPVTGHEEKQKRFDELEAQFKSMYSIQEVTMSLGKK